MNESEKRKDDALARRQTGRQAGRQAGMQACMQACRHEVS